jgi:hypothetical protein
MPHALGHWVLPRADAPRPSKTVTEEGSGMDEMQACTRDSR